jgi:FKBP-type peptidyl-prolyl cis-trans isomerase FklB
MKLKALALVTATSLFGFNTLAQTKKSVAKPTPRPAAKTIPAKVVSGGKTVFRSSLDSLSYAIGMNLGQSFKNQGLGNINTQLMIKSLNEVLKGQELALSPEASMAVIQSQMATLQMKKQQEEAKKYEPLKKEGADYLAANGAKEGVVTLPSGLQYKVITAGTGVKPMADQSVTVHYTGKLINGKVFDSSVERGQPATFGVTQVIQGWVEALQLMPQGSKWELSIPYNLAYGERGAGENIPPFSTLIFEVELLSISGGNTEAPTVEPVMEQPKKQD